MHGAHRPGVPHLARDIYNNGRAMYFEVQQRFALGTAMLYPRCDVASISETWLNVRAAMHYLPPLSSHVLLAKHAPVPCLILFNV